MAIPLSFLPTTGPEVSAVKPIDSPFVDERKGRRKRHAQNSTPRILCHLFGFLAVFCAGKYAAAHIPFPRAGVDPGDRVVPVCRVTTQRTKLLNTGEDKIFDDKLRQGLKFLDYAPVLHISALTGERTGRLLETIDEVDGARKRRVPTAELNRFLEQVTAQHPPASPGKKEVRILYGAQTGIEPPTFVLFTNIATRFHFSYQRFLVNRLREAFGFRGTPIRIYVRNRKRA